MPSVENLYWILYQHLLRPIGLDCWYYYPFGSQTNLSHSSEFDTYHYRRYDNHVLFHFDQEPLWSNNLGSKYENQQTLAWSVKVLKILANSEHSVIKKHILCDRNMHDWYFFYHGFAALNWFRDLKYVDQELSIENAYLCLNHLTEAYRIYRLDLVSRLLDRDIMTAGTVSLHTTKEKILLDLDCVKFINDTNKMKIINIFADQPLPYTVDKFLPGGALSANCGNKEYHLWQQSLFHVVTETVFYEPKLHLTEKIFKPIVAKRPFILVGAPGNLAYLRSYGFKTFGAWIDESYDNEPDHDVRLDLIVDQITKLSRLTKSQLRNLHQDMKATLDFNKQHFFCQFREIITDELLCNFETCLRLWNHGRIDGREVGIPKNFESLRSLLLR